jgi:hypothetical protein
MTTLANGPLRSELRALAERFDAAANRAYRAAVTEDQPAREAAEWERLEAFGAYEAAGRDVADLLLLLLRHCLRHRPEALADLLAEALQDELRPLAAAVADLQGREVC